MDMNIKVAKLPEAGETVVAGDYIMTPGGKGGNQALAAARVGAKTAIVGRVGNDDMGYTLTDYLKKNGVMTSGVVRSDDLSTGCGIVVRDATGENQIITTLGANAEVAAEQVPDEVLGPQNFLLVQMEVKHEETIKLIDRAHDRGTKIILNLAPATMLPKGALHKIDYLIVNSIEGRQMAEKMGLRVEDNAIKLAFALARAGNFTCILTIGRHGSVAVSPGGHAFEVPAYMVPENEVVDITGAGDCYTGTLAACLYEGKSLLDAMKYASVAGSLACRKVGAQASYPYWGDVTECVGEIVGVKESQLPV
jgi:ribokinase